jgi:hypothetical protein
MKKVVQKLSGERPRQCSTRKRGSEAPAMTGGRGGASEHLQVLLKVEKGLGEE